MAASQVIKQEFEPPKRSWKQILIGTYKSISADRVLAVAAGVTFYGLLAVFPAVAALVSLYGLFAEPVAIKGHLDQLSWLLPGGLVQVVGDQIQRVSSAGIKTLGLSSIIGIAITIWGANAGVKAIFDAINVAYGAREERSFIKLNLISIAFTLGAIGLAIIALAAVVVLPVYLQYVGLNALFDALLRYGRWPLIWAAIAIALSLLYRFGPTDSLDPKWRWITWGSALASLLWLAASAIFSWYAANFGSYNATYGSLGAVIGFMTWMWISAIVIMLGAELNSEIENAADEPHAQRLESGIPGTRIG
ncbi:MAG: YihY/virulence factor BrkB family protein [Nitrobacter sp.]|uniref:YihY/virulence factor BrkB family protein n=1 Tax=Nitrobacter sp. TaxID=29420 RepID=UPI002607E8BA|nr:YihY/virulence factor BrkB family protein [Nitrobacter sp.]MCV0387855.1 YihY/virulence factor BrkB family protein [Nitrobacter sp.]